MFVIQRLWIINQESWKETHQHRRDVDEKDTTLHWHHAGVVLKGLTWKESTPTHNWGLYVYIYIFYTYIMIWFCMGKKSSLCSIQTLNHTYIYISQKGHLWEAVIFSSGNFQVDLRGGRGFLYWHLCPGHLCRWKMVKCCGRFKRGCNVSKKCWEKVRWLSWNFVW